MKRERLKSLVLVLLVVINFALAGRILTDKKLWPNGYNFFSNMDFLNVSKWYSSAVNYFKGEEKDKNQILMPEKIIINTGDQTTRLSLNSSDVEFEQMAIETGKLLKSAFQNKKNEVSEITKDTLYQTLSADSLYLEYHREFDVKMFSELVGGKNNSMTNTDFTFSGIILTYSPKTEVYIPDLNNDKYYKITGVDKSKEIEKLSDDCIKRKAQSQTNIINYSFELGFDKTFGTQKTILNPFIQIYSTAIQMPSIKADNPFYNESGELNTGMVNKTLEIFGISPDTIGRYTKEDGEMVFVENNATMKIDTNGFIEYDATNSGIKISDGKSRYSDILGVLKIINKINVAAGRGNEMYLSGTDENKDVLSFDYSVSGVKVKLEYKKFASGVEVVVKDGYLKSYKQLVRNYTVTNNMTTPMEFFEALDNSILKYSEFMNEIKIEKMNLGYSDDGSVGEKNIDWIVDVDNVIVADK